MSQMTIKTALLSCAAMAMAFVGSAQNAAPKAEDMPAPDHVFTEAPNDHAMGDATAPLTMIVYASVTCGHCGSWFSKEWPKIKSDLVEAGKLRFVMRELPTQPQVLSMTGFALAECAPDADYFKVLEYQMENQESIFEDAKAGKAQEAYAKVGKLAGLETDEAIEACLRNQSNIDHIYLSVRRANAAEVAGVPAFYINGAPYKGPQDAAALIKLITEMDEAGVTELPKTLPRGDGSAATLMPKGDHDNHSGHDHD